MNFNLNLDKKKIIIGTIILLVASFLVIAIVSNADTGSNRVAIDSARITGIDTGTANFTNDGLNYSDPSSYSEINGYVSGNDSNEKNRIVRSFDKITYHFEFSITGKDNTGTYEERIVNIKTILPDDIAKYVAFDTKTVAGEKEHTFSFDGIDSYGLFKKDITLYILGAPNGTQINPKFEIQESTNTESNYIVSLGKTDTDAYNYEYDSQSAQNYSTTSSITGFLNYMPTIVSSKTANVNLKVLGQSNEGQKATYNDKSGRYLTYVVGLEIVGDETNGIKGYTMPNGNDITFNIANTQNGSTTSVDTNNDWTRLYGIDNISNIESVQVAMPYSSTTVDASKRTIAPGNLNVSGNTGTISGYNVTYSPVTINADNSRISNAEHYIGTYAISVFSPREASDGKNDITANMALSNISITDTAGTNLPVSNLSTNIVNKYYEVVDYSLTGEFYDTNNTKISRNSDNQLVNGYGSTSKGANLIYKTTFNYKKTLSNQGLKEIIKIDTNAFRVISLSKDDIKITIEGKDSAKLSKDDFEVKYIAGNYNSASYDVNINSRVSADDLATVQGTCPNNLESYSINQIMNLYGGPCIKSKTNTELTFTKIDDAKTDDNKEVPISAIVIQTKNKKVLPDDVKVIVEVGIRVRNVTDLTQTYQITSSASSSDYDSILTYYSPRVTSDENSITNPNNYKKTIYQGTNATSVDTDSPWGDSLKIVNFNSKQEITVTNKNSDGTIKTAYNVNKGETLNYNIKTTINDQNMNVGADDTWWIKNLKVVVTLPEELTYIQDDNLGKPEVSNNGKTLTYMLPYTKPNMKITDINFKASINPTLRGSGVPITVSSTAEAININGERDTSYFGYLTGSFTIYATGIDNVIVSQKAGEEGSIVEKDSEFSYLLGAYNNTSNNITDYSIVDVLPSNNDKNSSTFSGSYKVKVTLPSSQDSAKVYCSTQEYSKLSNEVFNEMNQFDECADITEGFMNVTTIKITGIKINANSNIEDIKVSIKSVNNNYADKYVNSFVGASRTYAQNESNKVEIKVVDRTISGRVFIDNNEDGIESTTDKYMQNVPVTLYKLDEEDNLTKIDDTTTDKDGNYKFSNLDVGRYKVRASYDKSLYDLTLRYATEDAAVDSDAYKVEDGIAEISGKRVPTEVDGIRVDRTAEVIDNMNIGLIPRRMFGFDIDKVITKVELTYNNVLEVKEIANQKIVKEDVKKSLNASAKVYYGITITNNSASAGYVKLINENIPFGATFNENDPVNAGWKIVNGEVQNSTLSDDLINPGEKRVLQIALNIPPQTEYRSYVNTVTILDIEKYEPVSLSEDKNADSNLYNIGEAVTYAGVDWHVINTQSANGEQLVTLLADSKASNKRLGHTNNANATYKWSESQINNYINNDYLNTNSLNAPILVDNIICDDASGFQVASYGGTLQSEAKCQSNIYKSYKIRLLTETEYNRLKNSNLADLSWLYGNYDFWLQNSVFIDQSHDVYGRITDATNVKNLAKYSSKSNTSVQTGYNSNVNNWTRSSALKEVRPVITISNRNIIAE